MITVLSIRFIQYLQNNINAIDNNSNNSKNMYIADDNGSIGINIVFMYFINNMVLFYLIL